MTASLNKKKEVIMRRFFFILIGIISGCLAMYFFACSPAQAFKFKLPGATLSASEISFAAGRTWVLLAP
jgi:hypothetical protein